MEHRGFECHVEHQRIEGDVHVSHNPRDDDKPEGTAVDDDEGAGDRDEDISEEGDDGKGDVELDSAVKPPHLQQGHHQAQRHSSKDGARQNLVSGATPIQCV